MLEKLLKRKARLYKKMQRMLDEADAEGRGITGKEDKKFSELEKEFDEVSKSIELAEKQEERKKKLDALKTPPLFAGNNTETEQQRDIDLTKEQVKRYSLFNVIRALESGDMSQAEYEVGISREIAKNLGTRPRGIFIPSQVQRAVLTTANTGALVATDHRADLFVESLKADSIVLGMGARMLTDLIGDVEIPRSMGGMSFGFVAEDGESPETNANFDSLNLSPKTVTGSISISRKLTKQSSPAIEKMIEDDMRLGMALMIDKVVLAGDGTANTPVGILNTTGVNTVTVTGTIPTFKETVQFETELADNNALRGTPNYVTTPAINGGWKTTPTDAGSGVMVNQNNTVNGYKSTGTTLLPSGKTIFGNFADVIIGTWGTMDLVLDTATNANTGGTVLRAWHEMDVAVRHPQSFTVTA